MTIKVWEKQLLHRVGEHVAGHGFRQLGGAASREFGKRSDDGELVLHLTIIKHENDFDVTADVGVRIDALEEFVTAHAHWLTAKNKSRTMSLGIELGNLKNRRPMRWSVQSEADVPRAALGIEKAFEEDGLPYMEKYQDPRAAYELLSADPMEARWHSLIHSERIKRVIGLAWLLGEPNIEGLVERQLAFLQTVKDPMRPGIAPFIEDLRQRGILPENPETSRA